MSGLSIYWILDHSFFALFKNHYVLWVELLYVSHLLLFSLKIFIIEVHHYTVPFIICIYQEMLSAFQWAVLIYLHIFSNNKLVIAINKAMKVVRIIYQTILLTLAAWSCGGVMIFPPSDCRWIELILSLKCVYLEKRLWQKDKEI